MWDDDTVRLVGGRCNDCATVTFPRLDGCPRCGAVDIASHALPTSGTLWTWTTQGFPVKAPYLGTTDDEFQPYVLGYVDLGEVRVESWLLADPDGLEIGMPMMLTTFVLDAPPPRGPVRSFAFVPGDPS